ncbi:DNRLRE domain-containing protein [Sorangium sp. So ce1151]|uniref:DNRLRE domain-containing protein n=1 Tax=Sorangium sp. So ce1151 TaxID=3133332 RepID=UPI003F5FFD1B
MSRRRRGAGCGRRRLVAPGALAGTGAVRSALLRFDLAGVRRRATLLTARVGLTLESTSGAGTISVHRVIKDWDESESWASFGQGGVDPAPATTYGTATATVTSHHAISFDVTGLVADWLSGKAEDHGMMLRADDGGYTRLLASEIQPRTASSRPWMHLCYLPGPP